MHYRLRAIRGVPLRVVNFTSHFIVIQIFQILFLPPVSFYSHPNISDRFVGDEINLFNLTFHDITIYQSEKGTRWTSWYLPPEYCTNICHQIFVILEVHFHLEGGLSGSRYFELFYSTWSLFSPCKISTSAEAPFYLFGSFLKLLTNFVF